MHPPVSLFFERFQLVTPGAAGPFLRGIPVAHDTFVVTTACKMVGIVGVFLRWFGKVVTERRRKSR